MKDELQPNLQRDFTLSSLRAGVRIDGRPLDSSRNVRIELGPAHGRAHVSLGRTIAVASASAEAVAPNPDRPAEGTIGINVEYSAASSEAAALDFAVLGAQPATDRASMMLRGTVEKVIRESRALDTEALCILIGKKVWAVSVHVFVIDAAGNAVDAAHLAAVAALLHARRNDVSISGTDVHIHPFSEREPLPLPIHHVPLTVTYALFAATSQFPDDVAVLDPLTAEESASDGALTVAMNSNGEVCGLHKAGGLPVEANLVMRCAHVAAERVVQLTHLLDKALQDSTAKHHPLSIARQVLVAPEPSATPSDSASQTLDSGDARMRGSGGNKALGAQGNVHGIANGGSSWNAIPVQEAPPPALDSSMHDNMSREEHSKPGNFAENLDPDHPSPAPSKSHSSREAARVLGKDTVTEAGRSKSWQFAAQQADMDDDKNINAVSHSSSGSSSDDSDEDLMAAVISKPRGGSSKSKTIDTGR